MTFHEKRILARLSHLVWTRTEGMDLDDLLSLERQGLIILSASLKRASITSQGMFVR